MKDWRVVLLLTLIFVFAGMVATYTLGFAGGFTGDPAQLFYLAGPVLAAIGGYYAARAYGRGNPYGHALMWITLGLASWLFAELVFIAFDIYLGIRPFPSVADVFYLLGYPMVFLGLYRLAKANEAEWTGERKVLTGVIAAMLATIVAYFGIYKAYDAAAPLLDNVVAMGYGVADLFLVLAALTVAVTALDMKQGALFRYWMWFSLGLAITLAADILFAIYNARYDAFDYYAKQIDVLYVASYLIFTWSLFGIGFAIKEAERELEAKVESIGNKPAKRAKR